METVKVTAKTKKGKDRIRQHGDEWRVVKAIHRGTDALLESTKTGYLKWCHPDFEVINSSQPK